VPQLQQVHPVAAQLAGQLRRGDPLGDAAKDQEDLRGPPLDPLQGGAGPGVEDAPTMPALVVEHGVAMAAMDTEPIAGAAARAGQAVGVEQGDELVVAGALIEQVDDGEIHDGPPGRRATADPRTPPADRVVKRPGTNPAS
jgi:hypothetical protein